MKKLLLILIALIGCYSLAYFIQRYSRIARAEKIIRNISRYQSHYHRLPATNDWATLSPLGVTGEEEASYLDYQKLDSATYQLAYVEGFDGPYLMWNSKEQEWKTDFPLIAPK